MASINLSGVLRNPDTTLAGGGEVRLIHRSNTGEVIAGFRETLIVNNDGTYDFNIQYGNVFIQTRDVGVNRWTDHGTITINQDTTATTLPGLLNAAVPPTDPLLLELQQLLSDAEAAADRAEAAGEGSIKVYPTLADIQADSELEAGKVVTDFQSKLDYYISETQETGGVPIIGTSPQLYANAGTYSKPWIPGETSVKDQIYVYHPETGLAIEVFALIDGAILGVEPDYSEDGGNFEKVYNAYNYKPEYLTPLSPLAKSISGILSLTVNAGLFLLYDGSDEGAKINQLISNVASSGVKKKIYFPAGNLSSSVSILVKSGNYDIEFDKNCKITFDAGVDGLVIGDAGPATYEGAIYNPWVVKSVLETSDNAYRFVNSTGAMYNPRQEGFAYAYAAKPPAQSRVAYMTVFNPRSRNHKRMIFLQPQDATSYVNSNSFIGGRAENFATDRLEYNILLDNQSGNGCQHNLIDSVISEGHSGPATNCGLASAKCINGSDYNEIRHIRAEPYGNGWGEGAGVIFDPTTVGNECVDSYYNTIVLDNGENSYNVPRGRKKSTTQAGSDTQPVEIAKRFGFVNKPFLDHSDSYSSSGNVSYLKYHTPRSQSRNGRLFDMSTGYGNVFQVDDAGTIFGVDAFADLGRASTNRYRDGFFVNAPTGTSDRNEKTDHTEIPLEFIQPLLAIVDNVSLWRWVQAKAEKSEDGKVARLHAGPYAQDIYVEFEKVGVDAFDYGFVGKDPHPTKGEIWNIRAVELQWLCLWAVRQRQKQIEKKIGM